MLFFQLMKKYDILRRQKRSYQKTENQSRKV